MGPARLNLEGAVFGSGLMLGGLKREIENCKSEHHLGKVSAGVDKITREKASILSLAA